jgi:hypothetical protein
MPQRQRPTENEYDNNQSDSLSRMATFTVEFRNVYSKLDEISSQITELRTAFITRVEFEYLKGRVAELEGTQKWIYRIIIGALILAGLGIVIKTQGTLK